MEPWILWGRRLQALAQNGLTYAESPFDRERYEEVRRIAAEILSHHSDAPVEKLIDFMRFERGYATPKVDVRGVVFQEDRILLVKERADGGWTLPGGWADVGDSPSSAAVREIWEESGYRARPLKLLALYDKNLQGHPPCLEHIYKVFILCELTGGAPATSDETDGVGFFALDEWPPLSLGRTTPRQLRRFFEHRDHPEWPADLD